MTGPGDLHELVRETAEYLRTYELVEDFAAAFDGVNLDQYRVPDGNPSGDSPDFGGIAALSEPRREALIASLRRVSGSLRWQRNPTYTDPVFLRRYAYTELLGPSGPVPNTTISAGFLYLAPQTYYPPHAHPAEEIYHLIAGPSIWQQGDQPGTECGAGSRIVHRSGVAHSMRSGDQPMLALYLWRGDLSSPARLT